MAIITALVPKPEKERVWVYLDGKYCTSIRTRTFGAMGLAVGQETTAQKLEDLEKFHWKTVYGKSAWDKEKVRLDLVKALVEHEEPRVDVGVVGFGANTNEFIASHPEQAGKPDLEITVKGTSMVLMAVEVTGTETMRGTTYWVRPDKLTYARNHPETNVWLVLHFAKPVRKFVFIQPDPTKDYQVSRINIRGSIEHFVEFSDSDTEVVPQEKFLQILSALVDFS